LEIRATQDRGKKHDLNLINVSYYAQTAIEKSRQALRSFLLKGRLKNEVNSGKPFKINSEGNPEPS
jgi:hypothetical protein